MAHSDRKVSHLASNWWWKQNGKHLSHHAPKRSLSKIICSSKLFCSHSSFVVSFLHSVKVRKSQHQSKKWLNKIPQLRTNSTVNGEPTPVSPVRACGFGRVVKIDTVKKVIVIQHQEIPNFMSAMTMPFFLEKTELVHGMPLKTILAEVQSENLRIKLALRSKQDLGSGLDIERKCPIFASDWNTLTQWHNANVKACVSFPVRTEHSLDLFKENPIRYKSEHIKNRFLANQLIKEWQKTFRKLSFRYFPLISSEEVLWAICYRILRSAVNASFWRFCSCLFPLAISLHRKQERLLEK